MEQRKLRAASRLPVTIVAWSSFMMRRRPMVDAVIVRTLGRFDNWRNLGMTFKKIRNIMNNLGDIRMFVEAANLGGLSAAGRKLGLSPRGCGRG